MLSEEMMRILLPLLVIFISVAVLSAEKNPDSQRQKSDFAQNRTENSQIEKKPKQFALHQNYPNPFNPQTLIKIETATESFIELTVHDTHGQHVQTLVSSTQPAGLYFVPWNGTDDNGNRLPSGIYYYRMRAGDFVDVKRMILLR
jgi:hypothetical protein